MIRKTLAAASLLASGLLLASPAQASQTDLVLTPDQMNASEGRFMVDQDDAYSTRTMRVQIPANQKLDPHGPKEGYFFVTVISGTLELGFGKTYDESKLKTLPPGSIFSHPASQQHFARTGNEPVVLQITVITPKGHHHHGKDGHSHDHKKGHDHSHGHKGHSHDHGKSDKSSNAK